MNKIIISLLVMAIAFTFSQPVAAQNMQELQDSLSSLFSSMAKTSNIEERKSYNQQIIPTFVSALKTENSFKKKFKNIEGLSVLYPADSTFRIFTWLVRLAEDDKSATGNLPSDKLYSADYYEYHGAIQMNSSDLVLYPLRDSTSLISFPEDKISTHENWYGSVYYNMTEKEDRGRKYYMLFGWKNSTPMSTKKIAEVLYFDENNKPVFGAPIFEVYKDGEAFGMKNRFILEYSNRASVSMNYYPSKDQILYDHVEPEQPEGKGIYHSYLPDGTYEGFEFKDGVWKHVEKVYSITNSDILENPTQLDTRKIKKDRKKRKKKK